MNWDNFHFLRPLWLWSALLLPPFLWLAWMQRSAAGSWRRICDARFLKRLLVDSEVHSSRWPLMLFGLGWLSAGLALAGPTWERLPQPVFESASSTMVVLDLSPPMDAADGSQSLLERARHKTLDALEHCRTGQVGLVAYAADPYPIMPLTADPDVLASMVPILTTDLLPGRGESLGAALDEARELLQQAGIAHGRILLLAHSAGDDPDAASRSASEAADQGYSVAVIGVGPQSAELRQVARAGGGLFAQLSADDSDLATVLPAISADGMALEENGETNSAYEDWRDMGPWVMLLPLLLAAFAFRKGWTGMPAFVFLGAMSGPNSVPFHPVEWFQRADQRAQVAFEEGRPEEAAQLFENTRWRAASLYRAGQYEKASELLSGLKDPESRYNLGNALAREGKLEQAIAAYEETLTSNPAHEDARFNRDLLTELLKEQKKQEEQKQSKDSEQDSKDQKQSGQQDQSEESGQDSQEKKQDQQEGQEQGEQQDQQQGQGEQQDQQQGEQESQEGQQPTGQAPQRDQADQPARPDESAETPDQESPQAEYEDVADSRATEQPVDEQREPDELRPGRESMDESNSNRAAPSAGDGRTTEEEQAVEQWLGRIPDDPAGLLRAKILRRYYQRHPRRP